MAKSKSPEEIAKIGIEVLRGEKTTAQIAENYDISEGRVNKYKKIVETVLAENKVSSLHIEENNDAITEFVKSLKENNEGQKGQRKLSKISIIIEVIAVLVLVFYTIYTNQIASHNKKLAEATDKLVPDRKPRFFSVFAPSSC